MTERLSDERLPDERLRVLLGGAESLAGIENREIVVLVRELIERREAEQWQPIETAPRDGVAFLACSGNWQTVACWNKHRHDWCCVAPTYPPYRFDEPLTHWRPLPPLSAGLAPPGGEHE